MTETDSALEDIQDALLDRLHAGENVDRSAELARHPRHAAALERFFDLLDVLEAPPAADDAPPTRLGDFEVVREIGRGGMGVVYEARQISLNRPVALKLLPPALRDDRARLARFRREAESAGRLRHPNIVPVYSIGDLAHAPFFAMELVEGRSLAAILTARRKGDDSGLPPAGEGWHRWCLEVGTKIADALAYAHGRGILHRDIKPGNILIDSDGAPRLTDFGLALDMETSSLTLSGEIFGSPRYMSPEQARVSRNPVDGRTDVYSLAVTLYELLTLQLPYHGTTSADILASLSQGDIVPPREADPQLSAAVESVLLRGLQRDPEQRYDNAAVFADDLRAVLDGQSPRAAKSGAAGRAGRGAATSAAARATMASGVGHGGESDLAAAGGGRARKRMSGWKVAAIVFAILAGIIISLSNRFLASSRSIDVPAPPPGPPGTPSIALVVPSSDELHALADGRHDDAAAIMASWLSPRFEMRSVVSRAEPGQARFETWYGVPDRLDDDLAIQLTPEFSVDGGPWRGLAAPALPSSLPPGGAGRHSSTLSIGMDVLLGDALAAGSETLSVTPRVLARIARVPDVLEFEDGRAPVLTGGTAWTWTGDTRTVFVYDEYPPDYPAAASGADIDAAMSEALTPVGVSYQGLRQLGPDARALAIALHFEPLPMGPVPAAFDIELFTASGEAPVARATYSSAALPAGSSREGRSYSVLYFDLVDPPSPEEQRLILDLEAGPPLDIRLRLTGSRGVALEQPLWDRYWNGEIDVVVPLRSPASR